MKSILTLLSIMVLLTVSGCKLLQVKGEVDGVEVEVKIKDSKEMPCSGSTNRVQGCRNR